MKKIKKIKDNIIKDVRNLLRLKQKVDNTTIKDKKVSSDYIRYKVKSMKKILQTSKSR